MKASARTRAGKRDARRGRPQLPVMISSREPNGRPSRRKGRAVLIENQESIENMQTVAATRMRHFNLKTVDQAIDPRRGYVLGRMFLDGTVSHRQHEAGLRYAEDMSRYYGLTGVQYPSARAQNMFAVRGSGGDDSASKAERAREARDKMKTLRSALLACGDINTGRRIQDTVQRICVEDIDEPRNLPVKMQAWLVRGLNELAKLYGC